jgi:transposase
MPRAYSLDLRERALVACEVGEGSQAEVARRFRVGERTLARWLRVARHEGRRGPKVPARCRCLVGGEASARAELVDEQNDATLAEYAERRAACTGVRRSLAAVCRALKRLGLGRKKRHPGRPSRTARMLPRHGRHGTPSWPRLTRPASSSSMRPGSIPA